MRGLPGVQLLKTISASGNTRGSPFSSIAEMLNSRPSDIGFREPASAIGLKAFLRARLHVRAEHHRAVVETERGIFRRRFHDIVAALFQIMPIRSHGPFRGWQSGRAHDLLGEGLVAGRHDLSLIHISEPT